MSHVDLDTAGASGFSFDALRAQVVSLGATRHWRLQGRAADGRELLLDLVGVTGSAVPPALLHSVRLERVAAQPVAGWSVAAAEGRFDAGTARLFVHEDVAALAAAAIPPRPVPMGKRLMWRAVFALLATSFGRRWLARRAAVA